MFASTSQDGPHRRLTSNRERFDEVEKRLLRLLGKLSVFRPASRRYGAPKGKPTSDDEIRRFHISRCSS